MFREHMWIIWRQNYVLHTYRRPTNKFAQLQWCNSDVTTSCRTLACKLCVALADIGFVVAASAALNENGCYPTKAL